jgi:hypothetical protein
MLGVAVSVYALQNVRLVHQTPSAPHSKGLWLIGPEQDCIYSGRSGSRGVQHAHYKKARGGPLSRGD